MNMYVNESFCKFRLATIIIMNFGLFASGATFQRIGGLPGMDPAYTISHAFAVSGDGQVVVGEAYELFSNTAYGQAFLWTKDDGMQGLGGFEGFGWNTEARGVSYDGSIIVGRGPSNNGLEAFRWNEDGMIGLGDIPGGPFQSQATGVSSDGAIIVGYGKTEIAGEVIRQAFKWQDGVMEPILEGHDSEACDVSADGSVIVGKYRPTMGAETVAFSWKENEGLKTWGVGEATRVSADGLTVVGAHTITIGVDSYTEAFRYKDDELVSLGYLPGGEHRSWAHDVSADGSVVVGFSSLQANVKAFIWDEDNGMRSLQQVLENDYGLDLTGWTLTEATGISNNGLTIVGQGLNPDGVIEGWIATIPEPTILAMLLLSSITLTKKRK